MEHKRIEPGTKGVERLLEIETRLKFSLQAYKPHLVVIEGYAFARPNQAHQIGELGGVIRRLLYLKEYKWIEVAPSAVKKFCTGKGNALKDLMLQQVFKRWGVELQTSDEADAYVLARIGDALLSEEQEGLTQFQVEVVNELRKKGA